MAALDKEIRLSFAQRIKGTLPEPYQPLISSAKEKDTPDFKFADESVPYSAQGRELVTLIRKKAPDTEIAPVLSAIESAASQLGVTDPLIQSTDAYMTAICFVGSKSLSHVLSCIERCKDRLLAIGPRSPAARRQIVTSVLTYWADHTGVGVNIIDKLLNYTILTPMSVIEWALIDHVERGTVLARSHVYEMVSGTIHKVTNRVRQIVQARAQPGLPAEQVAMLDVTLERERGDMRNLFALIQDSLTAIADGTNDEMMDGDENSVGNRGMGDVEAGLVRGWGARWIRVFQRKSAVEEAWIEEELGKPLPPAPEVVEKMEDGDGKEEVNGNGVKEEMEEEDIIE